MGFNGFVLRIHRRQLLSQLRSSTRTYLISYSSPELSPLPSSGQYLGLSGSFLCFVFLLLEGLQVLFVILHKRLI